MGEVASSPAAAAVASSPAAAAAMDRGVARGVERSIRTTTKM